MAIPPRKLTFQEAIDSCVVFYNDEELERKFDEFIEQRAREIEGYIPPSETALIKEDELIQFLRTQPNALSRILEQLNLSKEKFKRIVTLIRKLEEAFDREWSFKRIEAQIKKDDSFAYRMAKLLIEGSTDPLLESHLPKLYRQRLNLREMAKPANAFTLRIKLKDKYVGTYANWKGERIENLIQGELQKLKDAYGISFSKGITPLLNVTVNWAIPNLEDPYVIIMCSYQETTSSSQSTKARDMINCYQKIQDRNVRHLENRAFVNFVDGGGWIARKRDLQRLVVACHYFLNIRNLPMLEGIILRHVPQKYFGKSS